MVIRFCQLNMEVYMYVIIFRRYSCLIQVQLAIYSAGVGTWLISDFSFQ